MFHKFQVSHVTHQYFFLERTWLVYIQDGYDQWNKLDTDTLIPQKNFVCLFLYSATSTGQENPTLTTRTWKTQDNQWRYTKETDVEKIETY
jgi:hypothetical protein